MLIWILLPAVAIALSAPIVNTTLGEAVGFWSTVLGVQIASWRGLPFAAPPTANLRWRPPEPLTPWTGIRVLHVSIRKMLVFIFVNTTTFCCAL